MKLKKSLGQNFLKSKSAINKIIACSFLTPDDTVLEIGPGEGVLTEKLLETGAKVIAVEKDDRLIPILTEKFAKEIPNGQFTLIHSDILDLEFENSCLVMHFAEHGYFSAEKFLKSRSVDLAKSPQKAQLRRSFQIKNYKLIANIPYYITGQIIRKFLETENQPKLMILLVQKEVAERIVAKNKKESLLSLSVKAYGEPKYISTVPKGSFVPMPKVDSAIITIENISKNNFESKKSEQKFFEIIHAGFAHKRKQLLPNLSSIYPKEKLVKIFEELKINPKIRAEEIPIETWFKIAQYNKNTKA